MNNRKIGITVTRGRGKGHRSFEQVDAASVRAEAETEGMEIIRAVAKISLRLDERSSGPDLLIVHGMQTECLLGLTPARVRQARAIVTAAERKEVMPVVSSAQDISTRRDVGTAPPTAGPIPEAGALVRDERPKRGMWAPGTYTCGCLRCHRMFVGDKRALTCADCAYGDAPSPQPLAPVVSEETEEILEAIDSVIAQEAANRAIPAPVEGGTDVAGLITDLHKEIYNEYFDRDAVNKMFKRCAAALAAKEAEVNAKNKRLAGLNDQIDALLTRIAALEAALREIDGWRNDTLGKRPSEQMTEKEAALEAAFDRGARMAFYRCSDRARAELAQKGPSR